MIPCVMKESLRSWQGFPHSFRLEERNLHVWRIRIPEFEPWIYHFKQFLSPEDLVHFRDSSIAHQKNARILGRAAVRILMSNYTGVSAIRLKFFRSAQGKPELALPTGPSKLRFNTSYSKDWIAMAFGNGLEVGLDLEYVDEAFPAAEIARRFFTEKEAAAIHAATGRQKQRLFFDIWVRKEAYLKAVGTGLVQRLDSFTVPTDSPPIGSGHPESGSGMMEDNKTRWFFYDFPIDLDYAAAAVTSPAPVAVHLFHWNPSDTTFA